MGVHDFVCAAGLADRDPEKLRNSSCVGELEFVAGGAQIAGGTQYMGKTSAKAGRHPAASSVGPDAVSSIVRLVVISSPSAGPTPGTSIFL